MFAEQLAFGGILEGITLDKSRGAEPGIDAQEVTADLLSLLDLTIGREPGGEEAQVGRVARVERRRALPPFRRLGVVAGGICGQRDNRIAEEHVRVVR